MCRTHRCRYFNPHKAPSEGGGRCCLCIGPRGDRARGLCHIHKQAKYSAPESFCNWPTKDWYSNSAGSEHKPASPTTAAGKGTTRIHSNPDRFVSTREIRPWRDSDPEESKGKWPSFTRYRGDPKGYAYYEARKTPSPPAPKRRKPNNQPAKWVELTQEMRNELSRLTRSRSRFPTDNDLFRAAQQGKLTLNVLARHYPKMNQWRKKQGDSKFNQYLNVWLHKAMAAAGLNEDYIRKLQDCPEPLKAPGEYVQLQPYQMVAKYLLAPEAEEGLSRMLFAHGLGSGKTLSMIQVLDNFVFDPRPKLIIFPNEALTTNFYIELCTFGSYYQEWLTARLGKHTVLAAARKDSDALERVKKALEIPYFSKNYAVATWGGSGSEPPGAKSIGGTSDDMRIAGVTPGSFEKHFNDKTQPEPKKGYRWVLGGPVRAMTYDEFNTKNPPTILYRGRSWAENGQAGKFNSNERLLHQKIILMDEAHNLLQSQIDTNLKRTDFGQGKAERIKELRKYLSNKDLTKDSVIGFFTATPLISDYKEAVELLKIITAGDADKASRGYVSYFISREGNPAFPRHVPQGDMPRVIPVRPTGQALHKLLAELKHKITVEVDGARARVKQVRQAGKATASEAKLQKAMTCVVPCETSGAQCMLKVLQRHTTTTKKQREKIILQAKEHCPKLLAIAEDVALTADPNNDQELKTLIIMDKYGIRTLTLLLRLVAAKFGVPLADPVVITENYTFSRQQRTNFYDGKSEKDHYPRLEPQFAHVLMGKAGTTQSDRTNQLNSTKGVEKYTSGVLDRVFAPPENKTGKVVRVLLLDAANYSEGVSFSNVRRIILGTIPPQFSAMMQRIARASRFCKHTDFDNPDDRKLLVDMFVTVIDETAIRNHLVSLKCKRSELPQFTAAGRQCKSRGKAGKMAKVKPLKVKLPASAKKKFIADEAGKKPAKSKKPTLKDVRNKFPLDTGISAKARKAEWASLLKQEMAEWNKTNDAALAAWDAAVALAKNAWDTKYTDAVADVDRQNKAAREAYAAEQVRRTQEYTTTDFVFTADDDDGVLGLSDLMDVGLDKPIDTVVPTSDWTRFEQLRTSQQNFNAALCALHNISVDRELLYSAAGGICDPDNLRDPNAVMIKALQEMGRESVVGNWDIERPGRKSVNLLTDFVSWDPSRMEEEFPQRSDHKRLEPAHNFYTVGTLSRFLQYIAEQHEAVVIYGQPVDPSHTQESDLERVETAPLYFDSAQLGGTKKLYRAKSLWAQLAEAMYTRFAVFQLGITVYSGAWHANAIIVDFDTFRVIHYEPHGAASGSYDHTALNAELEKFASDARKELKTAYKFTFVPGSDFCPRDGIQTLVPKAVLTEVKTVDKKEMTFRRSGICVLYSLLFIHLVIANPELSMSEVADVLNDDPETLKRVAFSYLLRMGNEQGNNYSVELVRTEIDGETYKLIKPTRNRATSPLAVTAAPAAANPMAAKPTAARRRTPAKPKPARRRTPARGAK